MKLVQTQAGIEVLDYSRIHDVLSALSYTRYFIQYFIQYFLRYATMILVECSYTLLEAYDAAADKIEIDNV